MIRTEPNCSVLSNCCPASITAVADLGPTLQLDAE